MFSDTDRGEAQYYEKILFHCPFVYHRSHIYCPGTAPGPQRNLHKKVYVI